MILNILSFIGLVLAITIYLLLDSNRHGNDILRVIAGLLLVYKIGEYIYKNLHGIYSFPMEISTITYFMFSIIVVFNIKPAYNIASFYAILSGLGFFIYYTIFGYKSFLYFGLSKHIIAILSHGVLLFGGLYLFKHFKFSEEKKINIYLIILAIIAHASVFYIESIKNTTFIYFIIKPEFVEVFTKLWINHFLKVLYYIGLFFLFNKVICYFYNYNRLIHQQKLIEKDHIHRI